MRSLLKLAIIKASLFSSGEHTKTGDVVTFKASAAVPIDVKAAVRFIQTGTGDPSPENIRPITGWTGSTIHVSPTADPDGGESYTVTFSTPPGAVYGGVLDVTGGKLTVTHLGVTIRSQEWFRDKTSGANTFFRASLEGRRYGNDASGAIAYCSAYPFVGNRSSLARMANMNDHEMCLSSTNARVGIRDDSYESVADIKTAMGDEIIVCELETPVEYTLTAETISCLAGDNYVSASTGPVTVTFTGTPA